MKVGETKLPLSSLYLEVRYKQVGNEIPEATLWMKRCSIEPRVFSQAAKESVLTGLQTLTVEGPKKPAPV